MGGWSELHPNNQAEIKTNMFGAEPPHFSYLLVKFVEEKSFLQYLGCFEAGGLLFA